MSEQPKVERMLKVMMYMIDSRHYTIEEIAERLDISTRSVYRYLLTFRDAGFVVDDSVKGIPRLQKESPFFKDISQLIYFTDEEAHIFNQLLEGLHHSNPIKENLRRKLASVYNITSLAKCIVKNENAHNVNKLIEAVTNCRQVRLINYASSNSGIRDRLVEVLGFTTNYVQIWCYDIEDNTNKLFNTSRIEDVEILDTEWQYRHQHKIGFIDAFRMSGYNTERVRLRLSLKARNLLIEEFPLAEKDVAKVDITHWKLDTKIADYKGIGRFVMGLLDDIEIVDSPEFEKYIKDELKKICKKYNL